MTPQEIVHELDKHIVGQQAAKRAVAIALRNRWRRMQIPEPMRHEITPKNILMIGPDRRRQDRNRAAAGKTGQCAVREGRSDQVHRSRLCRPRRRIHRQGPRRCRHEDDPRAGGRQGARARGRCRRRARAGCLAAEGARDGLLDRRAAPAARRRDPPEAAQAAARGRPRRTRDRNRAARAARRRGNHGAPRHGGDAAAAAVNVREPRRPAHAGRAR